MTTILTTNDGRLIVAHIDSECRLAMDVGNRQVLFGRGDPERVFSELLRLTADELTGEDLGDFAGAAIRWGLMLSRPYCAFYAADRGSQRMLLGQTFEGQMIGPMNLTEEDRRRWRDRLLMARPR